MLETGIPYVQEWTQGRLTELRMAGKTAAQLREVAPRGQRVTWLRSGATRLGQLFISLGTELAAYGSGRQALT